MPLYRAGDAVAAASHRILLYFDTVATRAEENEMLRNENATLANESEALAAKVEQLTALLGTATPREGRTHVGSIITRPPESPYDTFLIAVGERDGVSVGMEAFGPGGVPIGTISSVLADVSRVTLFSSPGETTQGWVGHARTPLIITGAGGGAFSASIARAAGVVVGDTVFAGGPGMLPLGKVARIDSDPLSPGVTLYIMPAYNLFSSGAIVVRGTSAKP
jgi:cell shape-determining protein MreC